MADRIAAGRYIAYIGSNLFLLWLRLSTKSGRNYFCHSFALCDTREVMPMRAPD